MRKEEKEGRKKGRKEERKKGRKGGRESGCLFLGITMKKKDRKCFLYKNRKRFFFSLRARRKKKKKKEKKEKKEKRKKFER